jgi:hypothetical protein
MGGKLANHVKARNLEGISRLFYPDGMILRYPLASQQPVFPENA